MSSSRPEYSVASVVYNEADVVEESVRSIHSELSEYDIEHVIVDGGSSDGTTEVLRELQNEFPIKLINAVQTDTIGEDRNVSIRNCSGSYIINEIDLDDKFINLRQFVETYRQIETRNPNALLRGFKGTIARTEFWREHPYPEISRAEDKLPRKFAVRQRNFYDWTEKQVCVDLDDDSVMTGLIKDCGTRLGEFRCGFGILSTIRWDINRQLSKKRLLFRILTTPFLALIAFLKGRRKPIVDRTTYENSKKTV
jgi:glycosyltransferase involved in cell wall biosynthesis